MIVHRCSEFLSRPPVATLLWLGPLSLLALSLAGCSGIDEKLAMDAAEVRSTVEGRLGVAPPAPDLSVDDPGLVSEIHSLLEGELSEDKAVKIALLNNASVRRSYEELGIARADLVQAGLLKNPVFNANAKFFSGPTEVELGLAQSFLEIFFIPLRRRAASAELEATKAMVAREVVHVAFDVRRSFADLRAAQQHAELRRSVLDAAQASFELMSRLHRAGNVTDPQLTIEEVAASRARLALAEAETIVTEAREAINVLLGLWGNSVGWQVAGRLSESAAEGVVVDRVESRAITSSFDLSESRARAEAAAQRAGLSSWESLLSTGEVGPVGKRETSGKWGVGPGVSIALPLFDQGQARSAAAAATLRRELDRYTELAVEIRSAARTFRERLIALGDRAAYSKRMHLPLHARFVRETLQNYNAMQIGAFEVLRAKQEQIEVASQYVETLRIAWLSRLDLEELLAGSLNHGRLGPLPVSIGAASTPPTQKEH